MLGLFVCWDNGWKYLTLMIFSLVENVFTDHRTLCFLTYPRLKEISTNKFEKGVRKSLIPKMYKYKAKDGTLGN